MSQANLSAEIVLPFGDGEHLFALKWKQLELLEKQCNASIAQIAGRVISLQPFTYDIYHVLLLGLEGGGLSPILAKQLMDRYVDGQPIANPKNPHSPLATAAKVIAAAWFGTEDIKQSGEAQAGESPATE